MCRYLAVYIRVYFSVIVIVIVFLSEYLARGGGGGAKCKLPLCPSSERNPNSIIRTGGCLDNCKLSETLLHAAKYMHTNLP